MSALKKLVPAIALTATFFVFSAAVFSRTASGLFSLIGFRINLNLEKADLKGAQLRGRDIAFASIQNADLREANLSDAYMEEADLSVANLEGALLIDTRLPRARLKRANLVGTRFDGADLRGVDLEETTSLSPVQLEKAIVDKSTLLPDYLKQRVERESKRIVSPEAVLNQIASIPLQYKPDKLALSPDGTLIASAGQSPEIHVWRRGDKAYEPLARLANHESDIRSVAINPVDSQVIASGDENGIVKLWRVGEAAPFRTLSAYAPNEGFVFNIKFSDNGQTLFSSSFHYTHQKKAIRGWQTESGTLICATQFIREWIVDFNPDQNLVATAVLNSSVKRDVQLRSVTDGKELRHFVASRGTISTGAFSEDGKLLALGIEEEPWKWKVEVWRTDDGKMLGEPLSKELSKVESVAFSPDGVFLAVGQTDGSINLWNVRNGLMLQTLKAHQSHVYNVAFSRDGHVFASIGGDQTINVWQVLLK